jgi:catechol 2,3-dioxygenase-like lactoylglutathione lyase family enzyme
MKCIDLISVPVTDQQRAKAFYRRLGFHVLDESPMGNGRSWIQLGLEGCTTTISLVTWFSAMPAGSLHGLVLKTDDLARDVATLDTHGIAHSKVEETPNGKFVSLKDPDGNGISIQQRVNEKLQ